LQGSIPCCLSTRRCGSDVVQPRHVLGVGLSNAEQPCSCRILCGLEAEESRVFVHVDIIPVVDWDNTSCRQRFESKCCLLSWQLSTMRVASGASRKPLRSDKACGGCGMSRKVSESEVHHQFWQGGAKHPFCAAVVCPGRPGILVYFFGFTTCFAIYTRATPGARCTNDT